MEHFIIRDIETGVMSKTNKLILQNLSVKDIKRAVLGYYLKQHLGETPVSILDSMKQTDSNVYDFIYGAMKCDVSDSVVDTMFSNLHYLCTATEWGYKKQVYCFDNDFISELSNTDTKMTFPKSVFDRLPYRVICLDFTKSNSVKSVANMDSCCVAIDAVTALSGTVLKEYNIIRYVTYLNGVAKSVRVIVLASDEELEFSSQELDCTLTVGSDTKKDITLEDMTRTQAGIILKSLLYLCSYEPDIRETVVSKQRSRQAKKSIDKPVREFSVGVRFGEAFRKWTKGTLGAQTNTGTGQHKRPHVRRAHWHRYWVGKKNSDDRELIIKWVSECFCGVTDSSELDTVKHKVGV